MAFPVSFMPPVALSPTLAADEMVARLRQQQRPIKHMGFGQAPFPASPRMIDALCDAAQNKSYLPVAGLPELRGAVARHQQKHLGTDPESVDVMIAPGSKLILYAVQMAIAGDLLLPTPSWVSYAPQAKMIGQNVIPVKTELRDDGIYISAKGLEEAIRDARTQGLNPSKILLNYPNNPTGLTISIPVMKAIADVCIRENIVIISDEIYGRLTFEGGYQSISAFAPDHTIVTTGLSKHLSLGGWRVGVGTIPKSIEGLFDVLVGIASETWSCVAAPIQVAAIEAYSGHSDIEDFIQHSTRIHHVVTHHVADRLSMAGAPTIRPHGGFYVWPDFDKIRGIKTKGGIETSQELSAHLTEQFGLVSLPGSAFGEDPSKLYLRLATCDYDGALALDVLRQRGPDFSASDIASFAPNIIGAIEALEEFLNI